MGLFNPNINDLSLMNRADSAEAKNTQNFTHVHQLENRKFLTNTKLTHNCFMAIKCFARVVLPVISELELRQYENDSIQTKMIPTLKLPRIFTTYTVRGKARQFQNWNYF